MVAKDEENIATTAYFYLNKHGVLQSKGIAVKTSEIKYMFPKVVRQAENYGDCGVWVCIFLYRLSRNLPLTVNDPLQTVLAYRERMLQYFWRHKIEQEKTIVLDEVEAATGHIMAHTIQVYMGNSQSFENVAIQGHPAIPYAGFLEWRFLCRIVKKITRKNAVIKRASPRHGNQKSSKRSQRFKAEARNVKPQSKIVNHGQ
ncbi:phospholipase-like protein [Tanacetum coccineum]